MRWLVLLVLAGAGCDKLLGIDYIGAPSPDAPPAMGTWAEVAAGDAHTCAVRLDGSLWCWGRNDSAQLALDPATREVDTPTQVPGAWKHVATQYTTTCATHSDDTVWCWGSNPYGQVGSNSTANPQVTPSQVSSDHFTQVVAAYYSFCGLRDDGKVLCWGYNGNGELGTGDNASMPLPRPIDSALTFTALAAGSSHVCAIASDQTLWCWGYNAYAQLGVGDTSNRISPTLVGADRWQSIGAGYYHSCGVLVTGHLRCWGYSPHGQLGNTASNYSLVPEIVGVDNDGWSAVHSAHEQVCAERTDGSLWCWGLNDTLQLGTALAPPSDPVPTQVTGGPAHWTSLGLGRYHFCGVGDDHALWCAGMEHGGRLGDGTGSVVAPTQVMIGGVAIASGFTDTCTIDTGGARWCWGANAAGQLGDGTTQLRDQPTQTAPGGSLIALGESDGCVLDGSMHLRCWGSSPNYEIDPATTIHLTPIDVAASYAPWSTVAVGNHTCAITQAGALYCWGYSGHGEVGTGMTNTSIPNATAVTSPGGTWSSVANGDYHSCGVSSMGIYCWGYNAAYALGDGTAMDHTTPARVATVLASGTIYAAGDNSCLLSASQLYCWGTNQAGELGTGTLGATPMPTAVQGTWREVALGRQHTCAIALDGTLWCWGANMFGELGDGTLTDSTVARQIGTEHWTHVSVGDSHTCAIRSDGNVLCWGANESGELGLPHLRQPFFRLP